MCTCEEEVDEVDDDVMVRVEIQGISDWVPMDTAAKSIWVDEEWYRKRGGAVIEDQGGADSADGTPIDVSGKGRFLF